MERQNTNKNGGAEVITFDALIVGRVKHWLRVFALDTAKQRPSMGKRGEQRGKLGRDRGQEGRLLQHGKLKGFIMSGKHDRPPETRGGRGGGRGVMLSVQI